MARWAVGPLRTAASVARRISGGDLEARVPERGPPEVQELARDLNAMTDRLADLLRANREYAANASHQLRTPLAALRLSLEEARDGPSRGDEIDHAIVQADRLAGIVEAMLELGRARERGSEATDLVVVAHEVAASLPDTGVGPGIDVTGRGQALADRERVREVLGNLVQNARRFARSTIRIDVAERGDRVLVAVEEDGTGISEEERGRVFDRFSRGPRPRGSGSGLGLAVARALVEADGGSIIAGVSQLGGARFEVSYPRASAAAPASTLEGARRPRGQVPIR
jgi:signal transduction histidine kinase